MLSGDPVLGAAHVALFKDLQNENTEPSLTTGAHHQYADDAAAYSKTELEPPVPFSPEAELDLAAQPVNQASMESLLVIDSGEALGGSGDLGIGLINSGTVAPGNSPGEQTVSSFLQTGEGTLEVEIGGYEVGVEYDRLNVEGLADLDGALSISLINGFTPQVGDSFEILTFGSVSGTFDNVLGSYGFGADSDYYFEIIEREDRIELVVRELLIGEGLSLLSENFADFDALGNLFNHDYFGVEPGSLEFDGTLQLSDSFYLSGGFSFGLDSEATSVMLSDGEAVLVDIWTLGTRDAEAYLGPNGPAGSDGSFGLSFSDVDLGFALFNASDFADERSWISTTGSIGSAAFDGLDGLSMSTSDFMLDFSLGFGVDGLGVENNLVIDLSASPLTISDSFGELAQFDDDGTLGERLRVGGNATFDVGGFSLNGDFWFSKDDTMLQAAGQNVSATLSAAGVDVGVTGANFGLLLSDSGTAMEASGNLQLSGADFASATADSVFIQYNDSGVDYTNYELTIADQTYTFGDLAAIALQEVSVSGLQANLAGVFSISGDFGFRQDGSVNELQVVANDATILLGAGEHQIGVSDASLGLLIKEDGRALEASGAAIVELGDDVELLADNSLIVWNETGVDLAGVSLTAGELSHTFTDLTASSTAQEVRLSGATMSVSDMFHASGNLAFRAGTDQVTLDDSSLVEVDILTVGSSDLDAFVGLNGGTAEALGLTLSGAEFALALLSDRSDSSRQWAALQASADAATFAGSDALTLSADTLDVEINLADDTGRLVDFGDQNVVVNTGVTETFTLDMSGDEGELLRASGNLDVEVSEFFSASGGFALEKYSGQVMLEDGSSVEADILTIGSLDVSAFVGANGNSEDAQGFQLGGVDLALALLVDQTDGARQWASVQAEADSAAFVGVDDLTIGGDTMSVSLNLASNDGLVVDYAAQSLDVSTGPDSSITLTMDGSDGELLRASGNLDINVADFFSVNGGFAFEKASEQITLDDGS
ncbi:hypothetical protein HBA55_36965, partial [Pseudomaricurvus alkylphenolicus]|uniref:hypothetical protein n=1 Tax=Pseudomaricurvus alkylphenolicus TaxID=1306991 RepID=UPI00198036E5